MKSNKRRQKQKRTRRVTLTRNDQRNMSTFGLDPNDDRHVLNYAKAKTEAGDVCYQHKMTLRLPAATIIHLNRLALLSHTTREEVAQVMIAMSVMAKKERIEE